MPVLPCYFPLDRSRSQPVCPPDMRGLPLTKVRRTSGSTQQALIFALIWVRFPLSTSIHDFQNTNHSSRLHQKNLRYLCFPYRVSTLDRDSHEATRCWFEALTLQVHACLMIWSQPLPWMTNTKEVANDLTDAVSLPEGSLGGKYWRPFSKQTASNNLAHKCCLKDHGFHFYPIIYVVCFP